MQTVTDIGSGVEDTGTVQGLSANGTHTSDNYTIQLTVGNGSMGQRISLSDGTSVSGIGLYEGQGQNDIGGVLKDMTFQNAGGTTMQVALATGSEAGCLVRDNKVSFSGNSTSCTLEFTGSEIEKVDIDDGSQAGSVLYTVDTAKGAGAGHTYQNQVNYIISVASA